MMLKGFYHDFKPLIDAKVVHNMILRMVTTSCNTLVIFLFINWK